MVTVGPMTLEEKNLDVLSKAANRMVLSMSNEKVVLNTNIHGAVLILDLVLIHIVDPDLIPGPGNLE